MALPNPTSQVTASATLLVTDIASSAQIVNHIIPSINFKSISVQYQGYLNVASGSALNFAPVSPVVAWGVVFIRNIGGQGSGNLGLALTSNGGGVGTINLDVGAMYLFISPLLSSVSIGGVLPGITFATLSTSASTSTNVEMMLAG